jgi:hypothetical protein
MYEEVEVQLHAFLNSAVDGGVCSLSFLGRFIPDTNRIGGWMEPRVGLDALETRKISYPSRESKPEFLDVQSLAWSLCTLSCFSLLWNIYFMFLQ